jgi:hypothetical protein
VGTDTAHINRIIHHSLSSSPETAVIFPNPFHTGAALYASTALAGTFNTQSSMLTSAKTLLLMFCGVGLRLVTEVKLLQPEKASSPIFFTELGMFTEVKPVHS